MIFVQFFFTADYFESHWTRSICSLSIYWGADFSAYKEHGYQPNKKSCKAKKSNAKVKSISVEVGSEGEVKIVLADICNEKSEQQPTISPQTVR